MSTHIAITFLILAIALSTACSSGELDAAKRIIEKSLLDPKATQYRNIKEYSNGVICGEYNTKNAFGAYVGFQSFVYQRNKILNPRIGTTLCANNNKEALESALLSAESALLSAESALLSAESDFAKADVNFKAITAKIRTDLLGLKSIPESSKDQAHEAIMTANKQVNKARSALNQAEQRVDQAKRRVNFLKFPGIDW